MIVDPELLPEAPAAFQQYVEEFFTKQKVLGKECFVASTVLSYQYPHYGGKVQKGTAPSHSVDLMRFKDGLKKDENLNDWMRKKGVEGKFFWQFYDHEPSHSCGACDDD
jgi:hypothetical protein